MEELIKTLIEQNKALVEKLDSLEAAFEQFTEDMQNNVDRLVDEAIRGNSGD